MRGRRNPLLRRADAIGGVPLVLVLGLLPRRKRPRNIRRIGLLKTAAIGDTALLSGVTRDIAEAFPQAELVLVTGDDNAAVASLLGPPGMRHLRISPVNPWSAVRTLRAACFDVLVDCGSWPRIDAVLTALSGARWRVGFRTAGQHRHYAYDLAIPHSADVHETVNYRALAAALGANGANSPGLVPPPNPRSQLPEQPFIVFHPWSGGYRGEIKQWPSARWVALAGQLSDVGTVVITGSSEQRDESSRLADLMRATGVRAECAAGRYSLVDLCDVLIGAEVVVSVNTGIMHISSLLGAPTVCLDGPTSASRWGPVGPRSLSVSPALDGCGYVHLGFEYDRQRTDCMEHILVNDVERAVRTLIDA